MKLSQEGPALAVGDINGDGNDDFFMGGGAGQSGIIYQHRGNGKIIPIPSPAFDADASFEDTAAAFFDADGDADLDLMVATGGNQIGKEPTYRPRLYLNNGKGQFTRSTEELPSANKNMSTVTPADYDGDGDIDVFIGSRSVVGVYGVSPEQLLLENQGDGTFKNVTERTANDLKHAGMVTDAVWTDLDGNGHPDLITVADWGTPTLFMNNGRRLGRLRSSLDTLDGWWNAISAADLDGDGDMDLVLGNQGTNLHYKPLPGKPVKMWVNDFDNNGTLEQIVTLTDNGGDYPIHQKKELTAQIVSLKKANLRASDYARRTLSELFTPELVDRSIVKQAKYSESVIAINDGNGVFRIQPLPARVQLSCICDIRCLDVNADGNLDLVMAGNNFEFKPQFSRLDAGYGNVLLGDGQLGFEWQPYTESGFTVREEVKYIRELKDASGRQYILIAANESQPRLFAIHD